MTPRVWRVVAVLGGATGGHAVDVADAVRDAMADLDARVYRSGRHLVVVTSVPGRDGHTARATFARRLASVLGRAGPVVTVDDVWHGARPVRRRAEHAA